MEVIIHRLPKNQGPASARNIGLMECLKRRIGVICFTDVDCIPSRQWVFEAWKHGKNFIETPLILSGRTLSYGHSIFDMFHNIFGTLNGRLILTGSNRGQLLYGTTCNMVITNTLARYVRFYEGFREASFEDIDFCIRSRKRLLGTRIHYVSSLVIHHDFAYYSWKDDGFADFVVGNTRRLIRQFARYGRWEKQMMERHTEYDLWLSNSCEISVITGAH